MAHFAGNCHIAWSDNDRGEENSIEEITERPVGRLPENLIGENRPLKRITKLLVERALEAERPEHLGHDKNEPMKNPAIKYHARIGSPPDRLAYTRFDDNPAPPISNYNLESSTQPYLLVALPWFHVHQIVGKFLMKGG